MRERLKALLEWATIASGAAAARRRRMRGRTLILAYHNVVADGAPPRGSLSLHLPLRQFREQMDAVAHLGTVVAIHRMAEPASDDRPRFVITFDDAYADALALAIPELRRRNLPATVFVAPALLGQTPWWDRMADPATGHPPAGDHDHAQIDLKGRHDAVAEWIAGNRTLDRAGPDAPRIGTMEELSSALAYEGLSVGSHTWSHANVAVLEDAELATELGRPSEWLAHNFPGRYVPWLAYPYGLASGAAQRAASAARYDGALKVAGGWLAAGQPKDAFALPRLNIPRGLSTRGFVMRLSGIVPAAAGE